MARGPRGRVVVVGAGTPLPGGGDDLSWIDAWDHWARGVTYDVMHREPPRGPLLADALWVGRRDSSSAFIIWTGSGFALERHER